ncbi:murein biosynthesis integral membrane protein MurJ [Tenggerimyces flavus]|uniref:Murein biosynthesis integral membrane protein MurJ n=1 Tax=Tenggerimyces flavus TaxID=1708749 RepID=A0ABV7YFL2_9ACTN|nr:murein biosynthesis integral membrane protein MurJ [Tenggerimyces flavus]MBM7784329.1 putative peptidoglycan lipid II flippase [Tenggerimyces flavus]
MSDQADVDARQPGSEPNEPGLLRASAVMAVGTIVSRITGFARNLVLAWAIGTVLFADAFNLANMVPTTLYVLIAGGALNAVFVPQLVRAMKNDDDNGEAFGQRLLTLAAMILAVGSVLAVLAAPWVIRAFAGHQLLSGPNKEFFELAVAFARYCLPQLFFYGLYTIFGQILNARGNFGPMMWAPILNNIVSIGVLLTFIGVSDLNVTEQSSASMITGSETALLGISSTLGIAIQAVCLIPVLHKVGFRLRPRFDFRGAGLGKSGKLAIWTIALVLVNQVWALVVTRVATGAGAEAAAKLGDNVGYGLTPYLNAFLLQQLPHAVVTVSIVAALLPRMSHAAADEKPREVAASLSHGLRLVAVAVLPAAVALFVLGRDITIAMYFHADINRPSAVYVGTVLTAMAVGLVAFSSHHMVLRGFYAYEDTKTPLFLQVVIIGTSSSLAVVAAIVLPPEWVTVGAAAGNAIGYWIGYSVSLQVIRRRLGGIEGRKLAVTYARTFAAAALAGMVAYGVARLTTTLLGTSAWSSLAAVATGGTVMLVVYLVVAKFLRVAEVQEILGMVRGKLRR